MHHISPVTVRYSLSQLPEQLFSQLFSNPYPSPRPGVDVIQQVASRSILHYQVNLRFRVERFVQLNLGMKFKGDNEEF